MLPWYTKLYPACFAIIQGLPAYALTNAVTYLNHDTMMGYTVYVFDRDDNDKLAILDKITLSPGEMDDRTYKQSLKTICRLIVISDDGKRRYFENPFSLMMVSDCTVHISKDHILIRATFPSFMSTHTKHVTWQYALFLHRLGI